MLSNMDDMDRKIGIVVDALAKRFGRLPSEDEVYGFVFGDKHARYEIWNSGVSQPKRCVVKA